MIKSSTINANEVKMLELLVQGGTSKSMALNLGFKEGTMRVYLHHLYRKLGVNSKTRAVTWYLANAKHEIDGNPDDPLSLRGPGVEESFGDTALRTSLGASLGIMSTYFGGHGRMWEVAMRLKGTAMDARTHQIRQASRQIWGALLSGDFAHAKRIFDRGLTPKLFIDSPQDCLLVAIMLLIGGYSNAADQVMAQCKRREKGRLGISANEYKLVRAVRDALNPKSGERDNALASIYHLASENTTQQVFKHMAITSLFYVYREGRDLPRARDTADAIWAEAERVRVELQAMGEKPLHAAATLPRPTAVGATELRSYLGALVHA